MSERITQSTLEERRDRINEYFPDANISFHDTGERAYNRAIFVYTFRHPKAGMQERKWNLTQISEHMQEQWELIPELRVFTVDSELRNKRALAEEKTSELAKLRAYISELEEEKNDLDAKLAEMS